MPWNSKESKAGILHLKKLLTMRTMVTFSYCTGLLLVLLVINLNALKSANNCMTKHPGCRYSHIYSCSLDTCFAVKISKGVSDKQHLTYLMRPYSTANVSNPFFLCSVERQNWPLGGRSTIFFIC